MESKKVTRDEARLMARMRKQGATPKQIKDATGRDYNTIKRHTSMVSKQNKFNVNEHENWIA
jgi:DNA-binding CsgD family transcriptional regulator